MRLAIADPPYLGRGARLYGPGNQGRQYWRHGKMTLNTSEHPDAHEWDNLETHHALITQLEDNYDGWALAAASDTLAALLPACPDVHIACWVNPASYPSSRVYRAWEPVLLRIPKSRRARNGLMIRDTLTAPPPNVQHVGAKPRAWTRWVLDMLGYDQNTDTVDDLFAGSGAVQAELNQLTLEVHDA